MEVYGGPLTNHISMYLELNSSVTLNDLILWDNNCRCLRDIVHDIDIDDCIEAINTLTNGKLRDLVLVAFEKIFEKSWNEGDV